MTPSWSIYLIRDEKGSLYTGISTDVKRRFKEHCEGTGKGAKYTRSRSHLSLVYSCALGSRSLASRAEYRMKRLIKKKKEEIVRLSCRKDALLARLDISGNGS